MSESLQPPDVELGAEVQALLVRERGQRYQMPEAAHARIWGRVATDVAAHLPRPPGLAAHGIARTLGTLAVGAVMGAGGYALLTRQNVPTTPVAESKPAPVEPVAPVTAAPPNAAPEGVVAKPEIPKPNEPHLPAHRASKLRAAAPQAPAPKSTPTSDASLAAERTLIDMARTALTRGEAERALEAVTQHAKQFPQGTLSEEREALRIQVLLAQRDYDGAQEALAAFAKRFPMSLLFQALKASVEKEVGPNSAP